MAGRVARWRRDPLDPYYIETKIDVREETRWAYANALARLATLKNNIQTLGLVLTILLFCVFVFSTRWVIEFFLFMFFLALIHAWTQDAVDMIRWYLPAVIVKAKPQRRNSF